MRLWQTVAKGCVTRHSAAFFANPRSLATAPLHTAFTACLDRRVEGRGDEALRDLRLLEQDSLVGPAAMAASLYIHQQSLMVDSEAIARLQVGSARMVACARICAPPASVQHVDASPTCDVQGDLEMLESSASDESRVELARVHWCYGQRERARGLLEDVTLLTSKNVPAQSLLGWVILSQVLRGEACRRSQQRLSCPCWV